jgi:hypothetical protein
MDFESSGGGVGMMPDGGVMPEGGGVMPEGGGMMAEGGGVMRNSVIQGVSSGVIQGPTMMHQSQGGGVMQEMNNTMMQGAVGATIPEPNSGVIHQASSGGRVGFDSVHEGEGTLVLLCLFVFLQTSNMIFYTKFTRLLTFHLSTRIAVSLFIQ